MTSPSGVQDANAILDWGWDWTAWLATSETITTATVTVTSDNAGTDTSPMTTTNGQPTITAGKVGVWLVGGTPNVIYRVTCHVVTSAGRADDRTLTIRVAQR